MFEGVAIMQLRDGKIIEYHEVANTAPAFVDMNFAPERIAKIFAKQGAALKARPEMKRHLVRTQFSPVIPGRAKRSSKRGIRSRLLRARACARPGMTRWVTLTAAAHSSSASLRQRRHRRRPIGPFSS